uniref:MTS domain-containing protein n=1 Tax=Strongyloides stercoralis TaxID=6248 RepID=A0A0K0DSS6_STRER
MSSESHVPTPLYSLGLSYTSSIYDPSNDTFLLMDVLEEHKNELISLKPLLVFEIGSGSGVITVFLKKLLHPWVNFISLTSDINMNACRCTQETCSMNSFEKKIDSICCDTIKPFLPRICNKIDLLIFNPPYVLTEEKPRCEEELCYAGGPNGRHVLDGLLPRLKDVLTVVNFVDGGHLECSVVGNRIRGCENLFVLILIEVYLIPKMGNEHSGVSALDNHLFNLRFAAKELVRNSKKCEKEEKDEKNKLVAALKKGQREVAQVHAENAIRKKNEAINYLRMSARIDAVAARVQTAATQKRVTQSMSGVVKAMESAMKSMDLEKVQNLMDRFERDFENMDVTTATMDNAMSATSTLNVPQGDVDMLMKEASDQAGIELNMELPAGETGTIGIKVSTPAENDDLSQRLAALRQS